MDIIISISRVFTISVRLILENHNFKHKRQKRNDLISQREVVAAVTAGEMWLKAEAVGLAGYFWNYK